METVAPPSVDDDLHLLTEWGTPYDAPRRRKAAVLSVAGHLLAVLVIAFLPAGLSELTREPAEAHVTPLIEPPTELTQKAPNKGKISKEFDAVEALERPKIQIPLGAPSSTRPRAFRPAEVPQPVAVKPTAPLPEAPKVEALEPKLELPKIAQATPQIEAVERPRLALENPAAPPPPVAPGQSRVAVPNASISEAIRQAVRGGASGGLTIGDLDLNGPGGIGAGVNLPPTPGVQGSNLELLSDPQGVDFRPYLMRVLAAVRQNWLAVIPEVARLGRRGRVGLQFRINRGGTVVKLVIVGNSGTESLDRAAVAGVSASNPFPPLPSEYKGDSIALQFNFAYNMPRR